MRHFSVFIPFNICLESCFNCSNKLLSFWVDKVATGTYNFVPAILKGAPAGAFTAVQAGYSGPSCAGTAACVVISIKLHFPDRDKIRFIS